MINTTQYVIKQIEERDIRFIRLWFTDILGNLKSFAITPLDIEDAFTEGIGFDGSSIPGLTPGVHQGDLLVRPDAETFQVLPWRPSNNGVARMVCDLYTPDGKLCAGDSRSILRKVISDAVDMGYEPNVGCEMEYFYFGNSKSPEPLDRGGYFDLTPLDSASDLRRDTVLTLEKMGVPVEYSHHETAPSQHEIDLRVNDALSAADAVATARLVVKEIADSAGVHASFMPKPIAGVNGSAFHIHESLFDENGNAFFDDNDPDGYGLSSVAKSYIAGLLTYAPEFMLITNQYVNSYKRLVPHMEVPMYVSWGNKNRSTLIRVPRYRPHKSSATRVELRSADPAANPYLALAVTLAAGLRGIQDGLKLSAPVEVDVFNLTPQQREELGIATLPTDLSRATDLFEQSDFMKEVLGEQIHSFLVETKRAEWEAYRTAISDWEMQRYLPAL